MRMRSSTCAAAYVASVTWLTACGDNPDADALAASRVDSAGIEIVTCTVPAWSASDAWTVDPEPLFMIHGTDGGEENILLDPASIDVDSRGRIIVADGDQVGWHSILVYDSLGSLERRIGRQGEGPGEYGQLWWASVYRGDSIVGYDMSGNRINVYDSEGRYERSVRVPQIPGRARTPGAAGFTDGIDQAWPDGHFLAYPGGSIDGGPGDGPVWFRHSLLRMNPDGEAWDTLGEFGIFQRLWEGERPESYWYGLQGVRTVANDGGLYYGEAATFEFGHYDATGTLTRLVRRAYEPRPVTDDWKTLVRDWYLGRVASSPEVNEQVMERIRQQMDEARFAETLPAYSSFLVDDGDNLWVENFRWLVSDEAPAPGIPATWSVFDADGVWLGEVDVPDGLIMRKVRGDRVYGFVVDEFDVREIAVHRLRKPPST